MWREQLLCEGHAPKTVNTMLAALHHFFIFAGWTDWRVRYLRVQRKVLREPRRELTRTEYTKLLSAEEKRGQARLALLIETLGQWVSVSEKHNISRCRPPRPDGLIFA